MRLLGLIYTGLFSLCTALIKLILGQCGIHKPVEKKDKVKMCLDTSLIQILIKLFH